MTSETALIFSADRAKSARQPFVFLPKVTDLSFANGRGFDGVGLRW